MHRVVWKLTVTAADPSHPGERISPVQHPVVVKDCRSVSQRPVFASRTVMLGLLKVLPGLS